MTTTAGSGHAAISASLRQTWWWVPLAAGAAGTALGVVSIAVGIASVRLPLLGLWLTLVGVDQIVDTTRRHRRERSLGPVLGIGPEGLSIAGTDLSWSLIDRVAIRGFGWSLFGFRRCRLEVVSTGAVRFGRRTRRRPDRIVAPLSDLDRSPDELITALRSYAPASVLRGPTSGR